MVTELSNPQFGTTILDVLRPVRHAEEVKQDFLLHLLQRLLLLEQLCSFGSQQILFMVPSISISTMLVDRMS